MKTHVFISWSGPLSKDLAQELSVWLPSVLATIQPYFSPEDIDKGARWYPEIAEALERAQVGIICLTPYNLDKPWLLYEAGAIAKSVEKSRLCPVLFGVEPSQVEGPLSHVQATKFEKAEFFLLLKSINNSAGEDALGQTALERAFDRAWEELDTKVEVRPKSWTGLTPGYCDYSSSASSLRT